MSPKLRKEAPDESRQWSAPHGRQRPRMSLLGIAGAALATGLLAAAAGAAGEIDWNRLRESVVDLDVHRPESGTARRTFGFYLEGADGILTCFRTVRGGDRVTVTTRRGKTFEVTSYLACDPQADLILLKAPAAAQGLAQGSHLMLGQRQRAFVIVPPSARPPYDTKPTYTVTYLNTIAAPGIGELIGLYGNISAGLPVADSLGRVIGVTEDLREGSTFAICGIPIRKVTELLARPDLGGTLASLADRDSEPVAPWTQPQLAEGSQVVGALLCRNRKFSEGLPFLSRAVEKDPRLPETKLEWGMAYQIQREHEEAEVYYLEALELRPSYARGHHYLGASYFIQGSYQKAQEEYETAIELDPSLAISYVNLGGVYYLHRDTQRAEALFREALELEPMLGVAHYNLGMLLYGEGRTAELQEVVDLLRSHKSGFASALISRTGGQ